MNLLLIGCLFVVVLSAPQWKVVQQNFVTIALDVAFVSDTDGIAAVAENGSGGEILVTNDGGNSWQTASAPTELDYMGAAAQSTNGGAPYSVVASDFGGCQFTISSQSDPDSWNFTNSAMGGTVLVSQNVDDFGDGKSFGVVGQTVLGGNGVAVSVNNGKSFKFYNISNAVTGARYGAFPSATTWFVAAGQFPGGNAVQVDKQTGVITRRITERYSVSFDHKNKQYSHKLGAPRVHSHARIHPHGHQAPQEPEFGYIAQIMKTTNGGSTWTSVYLNHTYYFNQIACGTTQACVAVGESNEKAYPGIHIMATADGGNTWKATVLNTNPELSVIAAEFVSATEVWVGGALFGEIGNIKNAIFWHSLNGGQTWTNDTTSISGIFPVAMSFADSTHGFAVGINSGETSSFLSYS